MVYHLEYLGFATVDKRLSKPMIPWIIAQIRRGERKEKVTVRIEHGYVNVKNHKTDHVICTHSLGLVSRLTVQPTYIFYVVRDKDQPLLYCHLFETDDELTIVDMTASMKEQSSKFVNNRTSTTLCPDISPSSSHFFEVLYIGRMKVSHKKVPDMFIDDALDKFKHLEKMKKEKGDIQIHDNEEEVLEKKNEIFAAEEVVKHENEHPNMEGLRRRSGSVGNLMIKRHELCKDNGIHPEQNRTMVFHVGRTDLRLISPDRKQVLLHKYLKDITSSVQGVKHVTHFAFICKESGVEPVSYVAYLFNCQSSSVAEDLVSAISQASVNDKKTAVVSCEHCPMVWYHKLATELEGLNEKGMEEVLHKRLSCLPEEEYAIVQTKLGGAELPQGGVKEHIELIMMLLRAHCESKQARHVHDTIENRHEFLSHYLGGGAIFMKAKRSLTSSFDQLLKRRSSRDDIGPFLSLPTTATIKDIVTESRNESDSSDSPTDEPGTPGSMMNLFMKLGNTPKTPQHDPRFMDVDKKEPRSWRQAIFNTVVTPSKVMQENQQIKKKRDKQEYRDLWKKAIHQTRLLIRMEKENACLSARQEEANVKRIKLDYEELGAVDSSNFWDMIINEEKMCASSVMVNALKQGVPKTKRGEVWLHLVDQESLKTAPFDSTNFPNYDVPYEQLLTQLTSYQHAILIDLGRTFPSHKYFSSPLGPGQLALFNILKAYSLLDPEVGYCQGLSFIAAVLLLHMSEEEAFYLLRHLMFQRGFRTRYLPDMSALQVALYQFSRLLHDRHPELYKHFDDLEIHPTLYAAQWLLTIFTSQFSLGFVVRLFDLIFANSPNTLFKMSLALLGYHKQELMNCDSFELVMDYLKNKITNIDTIVMDKLLKETVSMDVSRELTEYGVEYHVLQEEMATPRPEAKKIKELEAVNLSLTQQINALNHRLQMETSNKNRLESSRASHMSQLNRLESEKKTLEVTVQTLGNFINDLLETHKEVNVPSDVARLVQQVNVRRRIRPQMSSPEIKLKEVRNKPEVAKNGIGRILTEEDKKALAARIESRLGKQIEEEVEIKKRSESPEPKLKVTQSSFELGHHPLDSNIVPTKFEGTTNLKKIQLAKTRTLADVKNIELKIVEKHTDTVSEKLKSTKNKVTRLFESCNDVFKREEHFDKPYGQETQLLIKSQAMPKKNGFLT